VLHRAFPKPNLSNFDPVIFTYSYRIAPRILDAITMVDPAAVVRWHNAGLRLFW